MDVLLFLIQVFAISLTGVMAPGPVTAAALALGAKRRSAGLLIALGHCMIELPLVVLLMLGLGRFFESQTAQVIIGFGGGGFLLFMGAGMFRGANSSTAEGKSKPSAGPVLTGFMLSAGNPYFPIWWIAVGLNLAMRAAELGVWALVLFAAIHWLCDGVWLQILSWASFKGTKIFGPKGQRILLTICAAALLFFGLLFIWNGARVLLA